jgi:hypothetical protein
MITRQRQAIGIGLPTGSVVHQPTGRPADKEEPAWLWESLRSRFWEPADLARGLRSAGGLESGQREVAAWWWPLLAAADQLGSRMYAAAFVRATEQHDSDQVRWSLLAMLRDEVQHEELFRLGMQSLGPGWSRRAGPRTPSGQADDHLVEANKEAERCWRAYQQALDRHGIAAVTGGLLLVGLVTAPLYDHCALGCAIPAFATAFRHLGRDAKRHQDALRALVTRDWPRLSASQRTAAVAQVQAAAGFLTTAMLGPAGTLRALVSGDPPSNLAIACREGLGVPSGEDRLEILRGALLKVKNLQALYGLPFPAIPHLAIPGSEQAAAITIVRDAD